METIFFGDDGSMLEANLSRTDVQDDLVPHCAFLYVCLDYTVCYINARSDG